MKRLLKIEWKKLVKYKAARRFTLLYFLLLVAIGLTLAFYKPEVGGIKLNFKMIGAFNFPDVWKNIAYAVAIAKIFIAVIIIMNVTSEYSNKTLKQNLIDGMTKKDFLLSKVLTNQIFAAISTVFVFLIALSLGLKYSTSTESIFTGVDFILAYFLKMSLFFSLALFLSFLLKRSTFAFLGVVVLWFGEIFLRIVEHFTRSGFSGEEAQAKVMMLTDYLPLNVSSSLIPFPKLNLAGFIMGQSAFTFESLEWRYVFVSILYIALFTYGSYLLLKKRDL